MSEEPLWYFAKAILRDRLGVFAILLAALWGLLGGVAVPLWLADFLQQIGKPEAANTAVRLVGGFIATAIVEMLRRAVTDKVRRDQRSKAANEIAKVLRNNPPVESEGSPQAYLPRFFAAQNHAIFILTGELPQIVVGLASFLVMLVFQDVPTWVILTIALLVFAAASAYWPLRKNNSLREAAEYENKEIELLVAVRSAWGLEQFQAALQRALNVATSATLNAQGRAHKHQHTYVNARVVINTAVGTAAVIAALSTNPTIAALLIVFALKFSGHLGIIHYIVEFLPKINVDAADLLAVIRRPVKPRLEPRPLEVCLETNRMSVTYQSKEAPAKVVTIGSLKTRENDTVLFTQKNGGGKTTFFRAIMGLVSYSGSLKIWGKERCNFDIRHLVAHFPQVRIPLPVTVQDLFLDDGERFNSRLMQQALAFANVPESFDLRQKHNELSGGQQQKVDLALVFYRALYLPEIRLVAIDEPTNNLDAPSVDHLRRTIELFRKEYKGCQLYTTHDPELQNMLQDGGCMNVS